VDNMDEKGYTEYGYRGLEELQAKDKEIAKLKEEISKLKIQLQGMENRCNDLQAKASLPRY
tara:strand:+ start:1141 stop:1323 length:183 start_codon:yes stop_codon:yes gene_type:complete